jgi:hypothetical protein
MGFAEGLLNGRLEGVQRATKPDIAGPLGLRAGVWCSIFVVRPVGGGAGLVALLARLCGHLLALLL